MTNFLLAMWHLHGQKGRAPGCAKLSPAFDFTAIVALVLALAGRVAQGHAGARINGIATPCAMVASAVSSGGTCPVGSTFRLVPFGFNPATSPLVVQLPTPPWPEHLDDYKRTNACTCFQTALLGYFGGTFRSPKVRSLYPVSASWRYS